MKSSNNGILFEFTELFRKFYVSEEYSEVAKIFRIVCTPTYGRPNLFLAVQLELSSENILYYNGHSNNEETKVGPKKTTGL